MRSNQYKASNSKGKNLIAIKKANLPSKPIHALDQLHVWVQLEGAEESFAKIFLVSELLWLVWAFRISTPYKQKQKLIPIIISSLKNKMPFIEEAIGRNNIFMK